MSGYKKSNNQHVNAPKVTVLASALRTAGATSAAVETDRAAARLTLKVDSVQGASPTLDVTMKTRESSSESSPRTLATFSQATVAGSERKCFGPLDREMLATYTIGGSNSTTAITKTAGATDITKSGTPTAGTERYWVQVTADGGRSVGKFKSSTDNGVTQSAETTIAANGSHTVAGVTFVFADSSYTTGWTYTWDAVVPGVTFSISGELI